MGNVYIAGTFTGTADFDPGIDSFNMTALGATDLFVTKLDASGNFIWAKQVGSSASFALLTPHGMAVNPAGDIYMTGEYQYVYDFDPSADVYNLTPYGGPYDQDVYVSKWNTSGDLEWVKSLGSTMQDFAGGIALDSSGNVYTTGGFSGTAHFDPGTLTNVLSSTLDAWGNSSKDIFISKLDASGNYVWATAMGGTSYEQGSAIAIAANGDIYSTGVFNDTTDFDPGVGTYQLIPVGAPYLGNIYVSKLDAEGFFQWTDQLGGTGTNTLTSIAVDAYNNVYMSGIVSGTADFNPGAGVDSLATGDIGNQDVFIWKLDGSGNFIWATKFGNTATDQSAGMAINTNGNLYITGTYKGDVDFNPGAEVYSLSAFGGGDAGDAFILKLQDSIPVIIDTTSHVGITEQPVSANTLGVYPNPNSGTFNLTMNVQSAEKLTIELVNIQGQLLKTIKQPTVNSGFNILVIDVADLTNGIYFLKTSNETIHNTMKIIINK